MENTENPILNYRSATMNTHPHDDPDGTPRCHFCAQRMRVMTMIAPEGVALVAYECECAPGNIEFRAPKDAA
jgi:hypothetical protein